MKLRPHKLGHDAKRTHRHARHGQAAAHMGGSHLSHDLRRGIQRAKRFDEQYRRNGFSNMLFTGCGGAADAVYFSPCVSRQSGLMYDTITGAGHRPMPPAIRSGYSAEQYQLSVSNITSSRWTGESCFVVHR